MRNIKTILPLILIIALTGISLNAARPFIIRRDGKQMNVKTLTANEKGVLSFTTGSGNINMKYKPYQYIYAHIPFPKDILNLKRQFQSKRYKDALKASDEAYKKYRYLGWGSCCIYYAVRSLEGLNKKDDAVKKAKLLEETPKNPEEMSFYLKVKQLEANILIEQKKYKEAEQALNILSKGNNQESAMFANNAKGDIFAGRGNDGEALFLYMRNVLLFNPDRSKESVKAITKTIKILKSQKNPRAAEFEAMK